MNTNATVLHPLPTPMSLFYIHYQHQCHCSTSTTNTDVTVLHPLQTPMPRFYIHYQHQCHCLKTSQTNYKQFMNSAANCFTGNDFGFKSSFHWCGKCHPLALLRNSNCWFHGSLQKNGQPQRLLRTLGQSER